MHTLIFLLMFVVHSFAATSEENDLSFVLQAETVSTHTVFHDRSFVMEYTTVNSDLEVAIHPTAATKPQASDEHAATVEFTSKIISQTAIETELPAFQELVSTYVSPTSPILRESQGGHLPMLVSHTSESFVVVTESPTNAEFSPTSESPTAEGQSITTEFNSVHSITNSDIIATFSELNSDIRNPITATTTAPEFATFAKTDNMHTTVELLENHVATGALKTSDSIDHTNRPVSATPIPFTDAFPSMTEPKMLLSNHMKPQSTTLTTEFSARSDVSRDAITSMLQGLTSTKSNFLSKATSMEPQSTTALKRSTKVTTKSLVTFMSTLASLETSTTTAELTASLGPGLLSAVLPITIRNATEFLIPSQTISKFTALEPHTTSIFIPSKSTGSIILTTMVPRLQANSIKSSSALESTLKRLTTETLRVTMSPDSQKSQTSMQSSGLKYNITPEPQSPTSTTSMSSSSLHERVHLITTNSANDLATSRAYPISSESVSLSNIQGTSLPSPVVTDQRLTMSTQPSPSNSFHISTVIQTKGTLDFNLVISSTEMHKDMPTSSTQPTSSTVIVMANNIKPTSTSKDSTSNLRLESLDNSQELHTTEQATTEFQGILSSMTKIVRVSMGRESQTTSAIQYNFKMQSPSKFETLSPYFLKPSITTPSHITTSHNISSTNHLRFSVLPSVDTDSSINSLHTTEFQSSSQSRTTRLLMTTGILSAADQPTVTNIPIGMEHLPTPSSGSSNTYLKVPSIEPTTSIKSTRITTESPSTPDNPTIQFPITVIEPPASVPGINHTITTLFEVQKMSSTTTNEMPPNTAPASTTEVITLQTNTATIAGDQLFNNMSVSTSVTSSTSPAQSSSSSKIKRVTISTTPSATMNSKSPLLLITSSTMPMLSETNEYSTLSESQSVTAFPTTKESTLSTTEMLSKAIPPRGTSYQQAMTVTREIKSITPSTTNLQEDTVTSTVHRNITDYSTDHYPSHLEVTPTNTHLPSTFAVTDTLESQTLQLPESSTETSPRVNILPTITKLPQSTTSESDTLTIRSISELLIPTKHFSNSASLTSEGLYTTTVDVRTPFIAVPSDIAMTVEPPSVSTKYISVAMSAINLSMSSQSSTTLAATPEYQPSINLAESHSLFRQSHSLPSSSIGGQILSSDYTKMSHHRNIVSLTITETEPTDIDSSYTSDYLLITESDLQIVNTRSILQVTLRPTPTVTPYPKVTPLLPPLDSILETSTTSLSVTKYQTVVNSKVTTASSQFKQAITTPRSLSSVNGESVIATTQQSEYLQATVTQSAMEPITPNNSTNILRISTITTSITSEFDDLMTVELTSISESHLTTRLPTIVPSMSFESYRSAESSTLQATSRTEFFSAVESYQPHMTEISSMVTPTTTGSEFDDIMTVEPTSISESHLTTRLPTIVPSMSFESYRSAESSTLQATSRTEFSSAVESQSTQVFTNTREYSEPSSTVEIINHQMTTATQQQPTIAKLPFPSITTDLMLKPTGLVSAGHLKSTVTSVVETISSILEVLHPSTTVSENVAASGLPSSSHSPQKPELSHTALPFSATYQPHMTEISSMVTPTTTGPGELPSATDTLSLTTTNDYHTKGPDREHLTNTELLQLLTAEPPVTTPTSPHSMFTIKHSLSTKKHDLTSENILITPSVTLEAQDIMSDSLPLSMTDYHNSFTDSRNLMSPIIVDTVSTTGLKPHIITSTTPVIQSMKPSHIAISSVTTSQSVLATDVHSQILDLPSVTVVRPTTAMSTELSPDVTESTTSAPENSITLVSSTSKTFVRSNVPVSKPAVTVILTTFESESINLEQMKPTSMESHAIAMSHTGMMELVMTNSPNIIEPSIVTNSVISTSVTKLPASIVKFTLSEILNTTPTDILSTTNLLLIPSTTLPSAFESVASIQSKTGARTEQNLPSSIQVSSTERNNVSVTTNVFPILINQSTTKPVESLSSLSIAPPTKSITSPTIVSHRFLSLTTEEYQHTIEPTSASILYSTPLSIAGSQDVANSLDTGLSRTTGNLASTNYGTILVPRLTQTPFTVITDPTQTASITNITSSSEVPHYPTSVQSPMITESEILNNTDFQTSLSMTIFEEPVSTEKPSDAKSYTNTESTAVTIVHTLLPSLTAYPTVTEIFPTSTSSETSMVPNISDSHGQISVTADPTSVQSPIVMESDTLRLDVSNSMEALSATITGKLVSTEKSSVTKLYTSTESTKVRDSYTLLPSLRAYPTMTEILSTSTSSGITMVPKITESPGHFSVITDPTDTTSLVITTLSTKMLYYTTLVQSPMVTESDIPNVTDFQTSMEVLSTTVLNELDTTSLVIITPSKEMPYYTTSVQSPTVTESDITDFQTSTDSEALSTTVQDELASTKSTVSYTLLPPLRASPTVTEIYPTSTSGTILLPKLTDTPGQFSVVADTFSRPFITKLPHTTSVQSPMVLESDITDSIKVLSTTITGELVSTATPSATKLYTNTESTTVTVSHVLQSSLRASPIFTDSEIFPTSVSSSSGTIMVLKKTESPNQFSSIIDPTDTTSLVIITTSKEMPYTTSVQSPMVTESDITDFHTSTEALSTTVQDELASTKSTVSHTLLPPLRASPTVTEIYPTSTSGTSLVPKLTYTTGQLSVVADTSSLSFIKEVPYTTSVQYPMVLESDITDSMEVTITGELVSTATPSVTELYMNTESTTVTVSHVLLPSLRASPVIVNSEIFPTSTSFGITMVPKITESPGHFSIITDPTDTTSLVIITPSKEMPYTTSVQSPIVTESDIPNITDFQTSTEALSTTVLDELASTKSTVSHTLLPPLGASPTVTEIYPTSTSGTILIPKLTDTPGQFSVVADTPSLAFITEVPYTTSIQSLMVESKLSDTTDFTKSTVSHTLLQSIRASPTVTEIFPTIRAFKTILVPRLTETPLSLVTDPTHTASIVSIISSTEVPHYPTTVQSPIISESGIPNITDLQTSTVTDTPLFTAEHSMLMPFTDDLKTNAIESSNTILPAYSTMETLYISVNLTHTLSPTKPSSMDIEFPSTSTAQPVITKVIPTPFESQKSMGMFTTTVSDKESYTSQPSAVGVYTTPTVLVSQFLSSATEDTVLFTTAPSISSTFTAIFSMATASEEYLYTTVLQTKDSSIPSAYTASLEHITESSSVVNIMTADIVLSPTATVSHPAMTAVIQTSSELQTSMNMFSATVSDKEFYTSQPTVTGLYSQFESSTSNMSQILPTLSQRPLNTLSSTIAHSLFPTHTDSFTMSRASEEYLATTKQETKDSSDTVSYTASLDSLTVVTLMSGSISHTSPHKVISTIAMISQNTADLPSVTKASYSNYLSITNLNTSPELSAKEFPTSIPGPTGTVAMVQDTTYVAVDSIPVPSFTTFSIVSELPTITGRSVTETNIPNFTKLQTSISTTTLEKATSTAQLSTINDSTNVKSPKSRIFQTQLFPSLTVHVEGSTVTDHVLITPTPTGSLIMEVSKIYSSSETPDSMVSHIPSLTITTDSEVATDSTTVQFQSTITPLIDPISATAMNTKSLTVASSMIADTHSYTTTYAEDKFSTTASTTNLSSLAPTSIGKLTCKQEVMTIEGTTFEWPETQVNSNAHFPCPKNSEYSMTRLCHYGGKWRTVDKQECGNLIKDFVNLTKTSEELTNNILGETAETLSTLVKQSVERGVEQSNDNLNEISTTFVNIASYVNKSNVMINETVIDNMVETMNSLLQWTPTAVSPNTASKIMGSFEMLTSLYTQQIPLNTAVNFTAPSITLTAEKAELETLQKVGRNLAFNNSGKPDREHVIPGQLFPEQDAAISLPASLFKVINTTDMSNVGMFFGLYENATLFPVGRESAANSETIQTQVCSRVLAATVGQSISVQDLQTDESVMVTFRLQNKLGMTVTPGSERCVSWDFDVQDWTQRGCTSNTRTDSDEVIICNCNHLTNFAVLVDVCALPEGCATPTEPPASTQLNGLNNSFTNLTSETVGNAVSDLAGVIGGTEESAANQNEEVLDIVADYFTILATFVDTSNVTVNSSVVADVIQVVSSLLQWEPENVVVDSSSSVVESFETVVALYAQQIPLNETQNFTLPSLTVVAERRTVKSLSIEGRSFKIGNEEAVLGPEGHVKSGQLSSHQHAAVDLPASLFHQINDHTSIGIFFMLYETTTLFPVDDEESVNSNETEVGSHVLSVTVGSGLNFQDLLHNITILLRLTSNNFTVTGSERCVSWDFDIQDWTTRGCTTTGIQDGTVTCNCNHLTNFAVLVDICLRQEDCAPSEVDPFLTYISYIGMSISIVFLVITIITLVIFKEVRKKDVSKYHIQMSLAILLMLLVSFVLVAMSAEDLVALYGGCMTVSVLVHYFTLVAVMWMGAEALLMFQKLVYVFYQITTKFIVSVSIVCWTVPMIFVAVPLIADLATGHDIKTDIIVKRANTTEDISYCFLSHVGAFWGAFLAPIFIIMIFNIIIFIRVIIVMIRHTRDSAARQKQSVSKKTILRLMISISGIMFLFGLTWLFAIFTFSVTGLKETFQILFVIFNSFQGFFIFFFICILNKDVLESWREVISCGKYRSKLLHPSPVKPVAVRKYNAKNAGFTSSSAGKYSATETLKDSYDSSTLTSQSATFKSIENVPKTVKIVTETSTCNRVEVTPDTNQNQVINGENKTTTSCRRKVDVRVVIHVHSDSDSDLDDSEYEIEQV